MRPLIIGRDPNGAPEPGELPLSRGSAGRRLAGLCGLDSPAELGDHFELVNLWREHQGPVIEDWDDARRRASNLMRLFVADRRVVLLGGDVSRAFGLTTEWFVWGGIVSLDGAQVARCPHPSGRTRFWNDPANVARGEAFFKELMS